MRKGILFVSKFIRLYILQFAAIAIILGIVFIFGREICFIIRPIWQPGSTYYFLKWVEANSICVYLVSLMISNFVLTLYYIWNLGEGINKTMFAISSITENPERQIVLPKRFHELEVDLNEMRIRTHTDQQAAKEAIQRKNDLIMYMAHDLKTPLTSVIGYLTLICQEKELPFELKEKYADIALKKSFRLEELINEFFDITRFNFTHMVLEKSTVNLSMMLQQITSEFMTEFNKKELDIHCNIEENIKCFCDVGKIERVFDNLFKNIINYSYVNTEVSITMKHTGYMLEIITENHGRTIAPEMLEHIFDQFFRVDNSRSSRTGGSGLGLAVAKEIIERHDGTIACESYDETIKFCIRLPAVRKS